MTTIVGRSFRSSPYRDVSETWNAIVELLTRGKNGEAHRELLAIAGIVSSLIVDQTPKSAPIVATCDGPRTRIYCLYDDNAIDDSNADEGNLGFDPLKGDWKLSLPCSKDELGWVQAALKKHSSRVTARDLSTGIVSDETSASKVQSLSLDLEGFLKS